MSAIAQTVAELLGGGPDIDLAVLFGSVAAGCSRPGSDLDLAIRWHDGEPMDRDALLAAIERAVGRTVDLVDLDAAPTQLRFEIARAGILLREHPSGAWARFRAAAYLEWWDFAPLARRINRAAVARLRAATDGQR